MKKHIDFFSFRDEAIGDYNTKTRQIVTGQTGHGRLKSVTQVEADEYTFRQGPFKTIAQADATGWLPIFPLAEDEVSKFYTNAAADIMFSAGGWDTGLLRPIEKTLFFLGRVLDNGGDMNQPMVYQPHLEKMTLIEAAVYYQILPVFEFLLARGAELPVLTSYGSNRNFKVPDGFFNGQKKTIMDLFKEAGFPLGPDFHLFEKIYLTAQLAKVMPTNLPAPKRSRM